MIDLVFWGIFPYIALTLLISGLIWRYRTDQFGWTSRSSQLNEGRILRAAAPMFHLGILMVAGGHVLGLIIPASFTRAVGINENMYHTIAVFGGGFAGGLTIIGLLGLLYRRIFNHSVRLATSKNDIFMYTFLLIAISLGATATTVNQIIAYPNGYNYRTTISIWFRSIFTFHPDIALMASVPLTFKIHIISGLLLFSIWPFTRLVHVVSAPVGFVTRPAIVYRSREADTTTAKVARGWDPVQVNEHYRDNKDNRVGSRGA